jgi:hypothetical protein
MGGGGGGGGKKKKETPPPQAQPIDYAQLMGNARAQSASDYQAVAQQSIAASQQSYLNQLNAQIEAYPKLEKLQLGTIGKLSDSLSGNNNAYTKRATDQLIAAEEQLGQLGRIGDYTEQLGYQAAGDLDGTDIERELQRQATSELQLGRSMTPEQERQATQQARAGMSARGLGVGNAAIAAEILNRDAYASQRESDRRNFAGSTNQMLVGNRQTRIGTTGTILGQSANTRMNQANIRSSLAGANITIDPYARAMNPALGMGGSTLGNSGQMIGNTYNSNLMMSGNLSQTATQMAGNVASFNANMLDSRYNSFQNNRAAMQGAAMQAGATAGASNSSMMGSGMAAGGMVLGMTALAI